MEEPSIWRILMVYGGLFAVVASAAWFPRSWWARQLRSRHGPDLAAELMTRGEAWRSAQGFLGIAVMGLITALLSTDMGDWLYGSIDRSMGLTAVAFMSGIGIMVGVAGALYMGARAIFRPKTMYRWAEDPLASATLLKRYQSTDGTVSVFIMEHDRQDFEVLTIAPLPPDARPGLTPRAFADGVLQTIARTVTLAEAERVALEATGHAAAGSGMPGA